MPYPSTPPEISEMMKTTCTWEQFIGFDGHGEPSYEPGLELKCHQEAHSLMQTGLSGHRQAELTTAYPDFELYFAGDDLNAQSFSLYDRFTPHGVATSSSIRLQPNNINTVYGPPYDNTNPWLIIVSF
jgi:hypothetical protein